MLVSTTPTVEGKQVKEYLGIVSGEAIMGANIMKDLSALVRDITGGRATKYEEELRQAKQIAMDEMIEEAQKQGANAIIAIDLDYESVGTGGMLMVSACGTAVVLE
jgi:uncharacterized protein YbjQ (UPF0145 family)